MKRHETTGKQFGYGLAGSERRDDVAMTVLEHENTGERRTVGGGIHGFTVPGRPVHPHLVSWFVILSGVSDRHSRALTQSKDLVFAGATIGVARSSDRNLIPPHDNAVITQYFNVFQFGP